MKYSIEFKDIDLELPNYNLDIAEALEKADKVNMSETKTYREKTETLYNTISNQFLKQNDLNRYHILCQYYSSLNKNFKVITWMLLMLLRVLKI